MKMFKETVELDSTGDNPSYFDITPQVKAIIKKSGIQEGIVTVISPHTTCAVFFEEFAHDVTEEGEEFLQVDLNNALEKIIPKHDRADKYLYPGEEHYAAVEAWPNAAEYLPDGDRRALWNGDAHLKATIIGASETLEVSGNDLGVGATGYIYFVDFDTTRPRTRKCKVTVIGE